MRLLPCKREQNGDWVGQIIWSTDTQSNCERLPGKIKETGSVQSGEERPWVGCIHASKLGEP